MIPDGSSLVLSLTGMHGDTVFLWKKVDLLKVGDDFITEALPMFADSLSVVFDINVSVPAMMYASAVVNAT